MENAEDAEECLNDTYLSAWNSMPEERPHLLQSFLAAIVRNHALDRYRKAHSIKRGSGELPVALDELLEVAGGTATEEAVDRNLLTEHLNEFLKGLTSENRILFLRRYFYVDSLSVIAEELSMSEAAVKSSLFRLRKRLKDYLEREGYVL